MNAKKTSAITLLLVLAAAGAARLFAPRPGLAEGVADPFAEEFDARDAARTRLRGAEADRRATGPSSCSALGCHPGEYKLWADERLGTHFRAFDALNAPRSLEMARRLGASDAAGDDPRTRPDCLACHAFAFGVPREASTEPRLEDGVSCEACHGRAREWLQRHYLKDAAIEAELRAAGKKEELAAWAATPPAERRALRARWWGLADLHDPGRASETCLRCHLGTGEKRVTHAMLAAGHPPLGFELGRDLAKVPRHWKDAALRLPGEDETSGWTRAWALGQLTALRESLREVAAGGADYALFECTGCHHAISTAAGERPSWQGAALDAEPGPPGEPHWNAAAWVVARRALALLAGSEDERARADAAARTIFHALAPHGAGVEAARGAARELMHEADHAAALAAARPFTRAEARGLLLAIVADRAAIARAGYRSAEAAVLAVDTLANDARALAPDELEKIDAPLGALLALVLGPDRAAPTWRVGAERLAGFDVKAFLAPMGEIAEKLGGEK
jgi:hypothetical protein